MSCHIRSVVNAHSPLGDGAGLTGARPPHPDSHFPSPGTAHGTHAPPAPPPQPDLYSPSGQRGREAPGAGLRVEVLGWRVEGFGLAVQGEGFRVWDVG